MIFLEGRYQGPSSHCDLTADMAFFEKESYEKAGPWVGSGSKSEVQPGPPEGRDGSDAGGSNQIRPGYPLGPTHLTQWSHREHSCKPLG